jgi:hypothetical protein
MYNLILIRQALFGNYIQVKNSYWAKATQELAKLSADNLQLAAQEFTDRKKISNPAVHSLITNIRIIGEDISLEEPGIKSKLLQLTIKNPSLVA